MFFFQGRRWLTVHTVWGINQISKTLRVNFTGPWLQAGDAKTTNLHTKRKIWNFGPKLFHNTPLHYQKYSCTSNTEDVGTRLCQAVYIVKNSPSTKFSNFRQISKTCDKLSTSNFLALQAAPTWDVHGSFEFSCMRLCERCFLKPIHYQNTSLLSYNTRVWILHKGVYNFLKCLLPEHEMVAQSYPLN